MKSYREGKKPGTLMVFVIAELVGILLCFLLSAITAMLIAKELIPESAGKIVTHIIRTLTAFVVAMIAGKRIGRGYALVCMSAVGVYMMLMIGIAILLFDSNFDGVVAGFVGCAVAATVACVICLARTGRRLKRKAVL